MNELPHFTLPDLEFFNGGEYALLLPGQGVQKEGMGWDLVRNSPAAWKVFYVAQEALGGEFYQTLLETMFAGSKEELSDTSITQPAIVLLSYAMHVAFFEAYPDLKSKNPHFTLVIVLVKLQRLR